MSDLDRVSYDLREAVHLMKRAIERLDPFNEGVNDDLKPAYGEDVSSQEIGEINLRSATQRLESISDRLDKIKA